MNRAVYRRLFATFAHRPGFLLGWFLEAVATFFIRIWAVVIIAQATTAVAQGNAEAAKRSVWVFLAVYTVGHILTAASSLLVMRSGNTQYRIESQGYYDKLTSKDMSFYRDNQTGYIVSMFRQYLDNSVVMSRFIVTDMTRTVMSLTFPVVILATVNWKIGAVAGLVVATQAVYMYWSSAQVNDARLRSLEAYRRMTGEVSDILTNIVAFRASGADGRVKQKVHEYAVDETEAYWERHKALTLYDLPRALLTTIGITMAFYFAVSSPMTGPETVGLLVLTLTYMFQIMRNVMELPTLITRHDDFVSKIYPTLAYLSDEHEDIRDPVRPQTIPRDHAEIAIENMSFRYASKSQSNGNVFTDLTLAVAPGEQVGIVGLSGAGKSTLAGLLMRFDEVNDGAIKINDVDIRKTKQTDLHSMIAYVPQEPLLFHRSIRDNIAYFMPGVSDAAVEKAARAAHAHEFIKDLPEGYDTMVGERGVKLSGGQKQRVAIARAVLKDAPIILFDEATSALDSESEAIIQRALPDILGKRTAIIIAHRLSTVAGLDRIIVLEKGKIIEEGTHSELLKLGGRYARLWQKQTRETKLA